MTLIHPIQLNKQPYEANLSLNGSSYHLICGKQINGWFLCIPDHQVGAELAHPSDSFWNRESLEHVGMTKQEAAIISKALRELSEYI